MTNGYKNLYHEARLPFSRKNTTWGTALVYNTTYMASLKYNDGHTSHGSSYSVRLFAMSEQWSYLDTTWEQVNYNF